MTGRIVGAIQRALFLWATAEGRRARRKRRIEHQLRAAGMSRTQSRKAAAERANAGR